MLWLYSGRGLHCLCLCHCHRHCLFLCNATASVTALPRLLYSYCLCTSHTVLHSTATRSPTHNILFCDFVLYCIVSYRIVLYFIVSYRFVSYLRCAAAGERLSLRRLVGQKLHGGQGTLLYHTISYHTIL